MTPKEKLEQALKIQALEKDATSLKEDHVDLKKIVEKLQARMAIMITLLGILVGSTSDTGGEIARKLITSLVGG